MRLLNDWISEELLKALGWTLVHTLWQLIVVAGVLWVILKLLKKSSPALKYGLAVAALVFSFLLTLGTFTYQWSQVEPNQGLTLAELGFSLTQSSANIQEMTLESRINQASIWIEGNLPVLVNFWFFGALLFLFRLVNSLSEIRNLRKSAGLIDDFELQKITYRLMGKMGINRSVELRTSGFAQSPLTFGTVKPIILLPAAILLQLTPIQLEAILAHELAHVKRNDYLSNLLLSGLEILFFFHPCYWWMSQTVKELRENAADDLALRAGIQPKVLATSLAEVLNFAKQNPPELALAAGKKRNPTLLRIKRMLGYQTENYPQTPIISIPMLLTLFLSIGLMASAQQDAPKPLVKPTISPLSKPIAPTNTLADTTSKRSNSDSDGNEFFFSENNEMVISDGDNSYRIHGDTLFTENGFIILSGKAKLALDQFRNGNFAPLPELEIPEAPEFYGDLNMPELPEFQFEFPAMEFETLAMIPMEPMPPMPAMEPMMFAFDPDDSFKFFVSDTVKMTKGEQEKLTKEMAERSEKWAKIAEEKAAEWAKRSEEWAAKWEEGSAERNAKMEAWKKEFEPKMKEFELKMQEWQKAQEPKMKEFELKMKEWEATQKPKMEEFQKKMEIWQKEHEAKLQEFQKLLQEELKKENN